MSQGGLVHIRHFPRALFCFCVVPEPSQLDCLVLLVTGYIGRQRTANTSISFLPLLCTPSMVDSTKPANRHQSMKYRQGFWGYYLCWGHQLDRLCPLRRFCLSIVIVDSPVSIARFLPKTRWSGNNSNAIHNEWFRMLILSSQTHKIRKLLRVMYR